MMTLFSKLLAVVLISTSFLSISDSVPEIGGRADDEPNHVVRHVQESTEKSEKPQKDRGTNDKKEKPDKEKNKPISKSSDYQVLVACTYDAGINETECSFTGLAPEKEKKINSIQLASSEVCADIVGGDYQYVDPDPNTNVTGYTSRGNEAAFSLIFEGEVTTSGSATYWFKVASSIFPASGPGLQCESVVTEDSAKNVPEATATTETTTATGSLTISTFTCTDVPTERDEYDWFGACQLLDESADYVLESVESDAEPVGKGVATAPGELTYGELEPGTYRLERTDATWCHAESDNVTDEGDVIILSGERTNVWIFFCSGE